MSIGFSGGGNALKEASEGIVYGSGSGVVGIDDAALVGTHGLDVGDTIEITEATMISMIPNILDTQISMRLIITDMDVGFTEDDFLILQGVGAGGDPENNINVTGDPLASYTKQQDDRVAGIVIDNGEFETGVDNPIGYSCEYRGRIT